MKKVLTYAETATSYWWSFGDGNGFSNNSNPSSDESNVSLDSYIVIRIIL